MYCFWGWEGKLNSQHSIKSCLISNNNILEWYICIYVYIRIYIKCWIFKTTPICFIYYQPVWEGALWNSQPLHDVSVINLPLQGDSSHNMIPKILWLTILNIHQCLDSCNIPRDFVSHLMVEKSTVAVPRQLETLPFWASLHWIARKRKPVLCSDYSLKNSTVGWVLEPKIWAIPSLMSLQQGSELSGWPWGSLSPESGAERPSCQVPSRVLAEWVLHRCLLQAGWAWGTTVPLGWNPYLLASLLVVGMAVCF